MAPDLAAIVRPGVLWWEGARVVDREPRLDPLLAEAEGRVRAHPPAESIAVRTMYKRVGLDPTKTRPSNEALLRRVRKDQPLPRVNSLVDVSTGARVNFSCRTGCTIGVMFAARSRSVSGARARNTQVSERTRSTSRDVSRLSTVTDRLAIQPRTRPAQWLQRQRPRRLSWSSHPSKWISAGCLACSIPRPRA